MSKITSEWLNLKLCLTSMTALEIRTGRCCCIGTGQMVHVPSQDDSTFMCEMMSWPPSWNYDVILEIPLCQWMHIYSKNNPAKFHPNPTRYDGALSISKEVAPTTTKDEKRYKISSWSNKKVSYCCDSWLYCMQYFNAIFIVIATSRPLNKKISE